MRRLPPSLLRILAVVALLIPVHPVLAADAGPALPDWLAGTWQMQTGAAWGDRIWTAPRGGQMLGLARRGFGPDVESWEYQRIVRKSGGTIAFVIQPSDGPPVEFPLAVMSEQAIEFANGAHEYPQRIRFWREGQLLMVEVARLDGSRAERWNYRPVAGPPPDGMSPQSP